MLLQVYLNNQHNMKIYLVLLNQSQKIKIFMVIKTVNIKKKIKDTIYLNKKLNFLNLLENI